MKNLTLLIAITIHASLLTFHAFSQSCLPEGIYFNTQEQIDNFQSNYPGCTEIEWNVTIDGDDITNLYGLNVLTSIYGDLIIGDPTFWGAGGNPLLTTLEGLENLALIGGNLLIGNWYNNQNLISLSGLEGLIAVGANVEISYNDQLASLSGLEGLTSIGGNLEVGYNDNLINLTGLEGLDSLEGDLWISSNNSLINLTGLEELISIGGYLYLYDNESLISLNGLESLTSIGENLSIRYNESLINLSGLEELTSVGGSVSILDSEALTNLTGLQNLTTIGENISINWNGSLVNLNGLEGLTVIGGDISIGGNEALINLTGLQNLTTIGGSINIGVIVQYGGINGNPSLTSLSGLENVEPASIGDLTIIGNGLLTTCDVQSICEYLAAPHGKVTIFGNASGCNNPGEIALSCGYSIPCLPYGDYHFSSQSDIDNFQTNFLGCTQLEGDVVIWGDDITTLQGLNVVTSVESDLKIGNRNEGNPLLESLSGLENLIHIGDNLLISGNETLINLNGLQNLITIGGGINIGVYGPWPPSIYGNPSLISLSGLENVEASSIYYLRIIGNILLSTCHIQSICEYLANPNSSIIINTNAPGCNSQQEVEDACWTLVDDRSYIDNLHIHPNPFSSKITFEFELKQAETITISIYNHLGELVEVITASKNAGHQKINWDSVGLPAGIYFNVLKTNEGVLTKKIIKL